MEPSPYLDKLEQQQHSVKAVYKNNVSLPVISHWSCASSTRSYPSRSPLATVKQVGAPGPGLTLVAAAAMWCRKGASFGVAAHTIQRASALYALYPHV